MWTNDWKNVEMTGVVKFISGDSSDSQTWYVGGGRHTEDVYSDGCEGTAYKGNLFYGSGNVRWAKEQWHVHYVFTSSKSSSAASVNKFVGFKSILYNFREQQLAVANWTGTCNAISNITQPTLVIVGTDDAPLQDSLMLAGRIPGSQVVQIRDAGHGANVSVSQ